MANNLAQALKDLNDSWTLKKLIVREITAGISRTIWNSHLIPSHEHIYLQQETANCLIVEDKSSAPNSGATLGFWVGGIVVESGRFGKELGWYKRPSSRLTL